MVNNGNKDIKIGTSAEKSFGLGRNLDDLLDDNSEITTMKSNVVIRKEDGSKVKIYDKVKGE